MTGSAAVDFTLRHLSSTALGTTYRKRKFETRMSDVQKLTVQDAQEPSEFDSLALVRLQLERKQQRRTDTAR